MTPDDLLDHVLGQLEGTRRERAEQTLSEDPEVAARADRLAQRLDQLLGDGPGPEPPPRLAERTIHRVQRQRRWRKVLEIGPRHTPFRLADIAMTACLFTAGVLVLLPVLNRDREAVRNLLCVENLHQIGRGLTGYALANGAYPLVTEDRHAPYAGAYALKIGQSGYLPDITRFLDCPSNGPSEIPSRLPSREMVAGLETGEVGRLPLFRNSDYAYHVGHLVNGQPASIPWNQSSPVPLLADGPSCNAHGHPLLGNSRNHGGQGQNVLFSDGRVDYLRSPRAGADLDIFHSRARRVEPGHDRDDHVLAPPYHLISLP